VIALAVALPLFVGLLLLLSWHLQLIAANKTTIEYQEVRIDLYSSGQLVPHCAMLFLGGGGRL
jgi:hypothetical protein